MYDGNERTVGIPLSEMLSMKILERKEYAVDCIEAYYKMKFLSTTPPTNVMKSSILALFLELQSALKRSPEGFKYDELKKDVLEGDAEKVIDSFYLMNEWLDKKNINRVDTKKTYDSTRVENENSEKNV